MIIGACGFGSTGSSAVSDYLLEFGNVQVLDNIEFTWVSLPDSLIDLDYHLNHPHMRTGDSIIAIQRYIELAKNSERVLRRHGGVDTNKFLKSVDSFVDSITTLKWDWYTKKSDNLFSKYFVDLFLLSRIIPRIEIKLKRQLHCWPFHPVRFAVNPSAFDEASRKHVHELLEAYGAKFDKPLILDQPFSGNNPQACFKYYEDPYAIVVDRDPRDNYVFARTKLLGRNHFMAVDTVEDFVKYYRALRENQPYKDPHERVLSIMFEDMVYKYDETTCKIREFLKLGDNPNPKSIFDPKISMPNTRVWLRYPEFKKDIEYIEKELPEYLYDYTGCPEPDLKGNMFFGKSPKNK